MSTPDHPISPTAPQIPDHSLLRCIDQGSYGQVWLARNVVGTFRGVKVIFRSNFEDSRPYEREFGGIQKFEPISRTHPGFVAILHIGRNDQKGYFYYVMELADDLSGGPVDPNTYIARTLRNERNHRGRIPLTECVRMGVSLSDALAHLHRQGLIHRDIKPSNVIFVDGRPKFADIGLVTLISEEASFVGTPGFVPPEGPGRPTADIYSFGMLLYEVAVGKTAKEFPTLPTHTDDLTASPEFFRLNQIILKACEPDRSQRFQSADEMRAALLDLAATVRVSSPRPRPSRDSERTPLLSETQMHLKKPLHVSVLYKSKAQADGRLLEILERELVEQGCEVFFDRHLAIGVEWAREIEKRIRDSDAVVILLSASSVESEMIAYEVEIADQAAQRHGKPRLLPVRINYDGPLPSSLATILDSLQYFLWETPADDSRLVAELIRALSKSQEVAAPKVRLKLESIGGAVPLDSSFYVERAADREFATAISRGDSIVLVKGARQMGKTSLLARGLQSARQAGAKVVLTDFQKLNSTHLASVESFFLTLGDFLADQLDLEVLPEQVWDKRRSANTNFERYLRRNVLGKLSTHFVWGLDEVDRLFTCPFGSEVFGLFRSWHNERALDPDGPWSRLTLAIAYATEAHLFITDVNQSPFNVGTRLTLDDFTLDLVADLNERYGSPLRDAAELRRFYGLVGGQPYLVRRAFNAMIAGEISLADFAENADRDEGVFGDHLRRILVLLAKDPELTEIVKAILRGVPAASGTTFYRLRSAGVMKGDSPREIRPRCEIYGSYLRRHLL